MLKDRRNWLTLSEGERLVLLALGHHERQQVHSPVPTANVQFVSGMDNPTFERTLDALSKKKLVKFPCSNRSSISLAGEAFSVSLGGDSYRSHNN